MSLDPKETACTRRVAARPVASSGSLVERSTRDGDVTDFTMKNGMEMEGLTDLPNLVMTFTGLAMNFSMALIEIDGLPFTENSMVDLSMAMLNYQMATLFNRWKNDDEFSGNYKDGGIHAQM